MGLFDSPSHLLIVLVVLVLLFGSAKLPKLAKSLGESMRIFKKEAQKLQHDDPAAAADQQAVQGAAQQHAVQQPPAQPPLPAPAPPVTVQMPDGTVVSGTPVDAPRGNQPG
jgi:sec-independent protein translocase protein TatA